jgi:hypothetical protein
MLSDPPHATLRKMERPTSFRFPLPDAVAALDGTSTFAFAAGSDRLPL